ncbi:hypothetical protein CYLTODRAFT_495035 [Cylindrobasidium torrendii FP15055 ss-10]|uniref:BTB domain-containing protein n=1 Tax=Cylindrobasidium torrendii FP15055 ss-10 TaxID=1314674 RepID=A0A0D7AUD5_9AGAR|nr:hypothetical protein CYLTODRAFT_495035 [Cylindrobasidium torrendii FP15055 ss-10]
MATQISMPPAPFDAADDSVDLIIHTSNDDRFYVSKSLLIYASPFFANLFKDSSPEERYQDLPVWRAQETSATVTALVRLCYPVHIELEDVLLPGVDLIALQKYLMEKSIGRLRTMMLKSPKGVGFTSKNPLRIVAIGHH